MDKILVVDFNATAPTYTYYFVGGLQGYGMKVDVLGVENKAFTEIHSEHKINYIGFNLGNKLLTYIANWFKLLVISKKYNAVHFQWLPMLNYASTELVLLRWLKKRQPNLFYTVHNFFPHDTIKEKVQKRYLDLYAMFGTLVVHTESTAQKIKRYVGTKKIIAIKHGYFFAEFRKTSIVTRKYDLAMLGTLLPYKGIEDAIEAVARLKRSNNKLVKLLLAGKCKEPFLRSLQDLVKVNGLEDQVEFDIGFLPVPRLLAYYNETKLSVMPYREIEQSGVLYTSLGMGVPIVGYETGGLADMVISDFNGRLSPNGDILQLVDSIAIGMRDWEIWSRNIREGRFQDFWKGNARILNQAYFK